MKIGKYYFSVDKKKIKSFFKTLPAIFLIAILTTLIGIGNIVGINAFIEGKTQWYPVAIFFFVVDGMFLLSLFFIIIFRVEIKGDKNKEISEKEAVIITCNLCANGHEFNSRKAIIGHLRTTHNISYERFMDESTDLVTYVEAPII